MEIVMVTALFAYLYYRAARRTAGSFGLELELPHWWTPVLSTVIAAALLAVILLLASAVKGGLPTILSILVLGGLVVLNVVAVRRRSRGTSG